MNKRRVIGWHAIQGHQKVNWNFSNLFHTNEPRQWAEHWAAIASWAVVKPWNDSGSR